MQLNDFLNHTSEWLRGTGPNSDIVISSRLRLARNLDKARFPHWADKAGGRQTLETIKEGIARVDYLKRVTFFYLADVDNVDKQFLVERHLMSLDHAQKPENKALVVDDEEIISIMINEEDHMSMQVMQS